MKTSSEIQYKGLNDYHILIEKGDNAGCYKRPTGKKLKEAKAFDNKIWIAADSLLKFISDRIKTLKNGVKILPPTAKYQYYARINELKELRKHIKGKENGNR